jgi:DNA-binding response OmpR family regulator
MSRILIVEDEEAIANLEKDYLELSGFEVKVESNGTDGLNTALNEEFDMFILDLMLPGVDGFDICERIREIKDNPILLVSAKKEDIDKIRGLGMGADDYITKPFSPSELVARVKAHLSRFERLTNAPSINNEIVNIRGLRIDKTARRVWVNGEEKQLTTKEFELLRLLIENKGVTLKKEYLFSSIWGSDSESELQTLTVHIKWLREKIEEDPKKPKHILTVWGVGYRFE